MDPEDDERLTQVKVRLPAHLKAALEAAAETNAVSVNRELILRLAAGLGQSDDPLLAEETMASALETLIRTRRALTQAYRIIYRRLRELSPNDPALELARIVRQGTPPEHRESDIGPTIAEPMEVEVEEIPANPDTGEPRRLVIHPKEPLTASTKRKLGLKPQTPTPKKPRPKPAPRSK